MKLEPFNQATKQWDRFKEFYNSVSLITNRGYYHEPFIYLETGEFIVTQGYYRPKHRKDYEAANISINNSDDYRWARILQHRKLVTPDGDEVKPSWLNHRGAQYLWIDYDTQTVLSMGRIELDKVDKRIPKRLRHHALIYYPAPDEQPIAARSIRVTNIDKLDTSERQHIKAIIAACKAWNTLSEEAKIPQTHPEYHHHSPTIYNNGSYQPNQFYYKGAPMPVSELLTLDFASMTWAQRKRVAMRGVKSRKKTAEYAYLKLTAR